MTARLTAALAGRYTIEHELGAGGMATVYLARDLKHDRDVALEVLRPELAAVLGTERFLDEIGIAARLDHPRILTLIDSGSADGFLYYVLPYVRGESLRARLNRERQLGLDEALGITRQVAAALDYAHRQGVVHRDIKPDNILIHEGEAVLTDFGIALAVREAGGQRLTDTGLSIGTPQYMSPEQATGERNPDARSDVYSLGAVLYEMLAGEPPVTGATAQAIIAKLLTERPVRLRVVRDTVPESVDRAVARALAKVPADRFPGAGEFAEALETRAPAGGGPSRRFSLAVAVIGLSAVAGLGIIGVMMARRTPAEGARTWTLRDRVQLTTSGNVLTSAISPDGKQLAFVTRNCTETVCTYPVDVQDVGGTATRRILDNAGGGEWLEWSPDRRNLIFRGTVDDQWGFWLLSALGGRPRYLSSGPATFWAGGDSLLVAPVQRGPDSVFHLRVTSIDGTGRDSIRVAGPGVGIVSITTAPGERWIVVGVARTAPALWKVIDRGGAVADSFSDRGSVRSQTRQAVWATRLSSGISTIIRIPRDPVTGRFASHEDSLYSGTFRGFTVTEDESALVIDDGTYEYSVWALDLADALRGRFPESRRLLRTSTPIRLPLLLSPDGARVLVARTLPSAAGRSETRLSVLPFDGGAEVPLGWQEPPLLWKWVDSVSIAVSTRTPRGKHLAVRDVRTGAELRAVDLPDSANAFEPLNDGWAWLPINADRIIVQRGGRTVVIPKPAWFTRIFGPVQAPSGGRIAFTGWGGGASGVDSLGIGMASLQGDSPAIWATRFSIGGPWPEFLEDGSILFVVEPTAEFRALYRLWGPGRFDSLGVIPRPIASVSASRDLRRAAILVRDYHGDAWMHRVAR